MRGARYGEAVEATVGMAWKETAEERDRLTAQSELFPRFLRESADRLFRKFRRRGDGRPQQRAFSTPLGTEGLADFRQTICTTDPIDTHEITSGCRKTRLENALEMLRVPNGKGERRKTEV
jgi:hypothetical protein